MKKLLVILLMLVLVLGIVGCSDDGGGVDSEVDVVDDSGTATEATDDDDAVVVDETATESTEATDDEEVDYMESDPLPESWHGEWVVVVAERYFSVGDFIYIKDFNNAWTYYFWLDEDTPWDNNRWFCYIEEEQILHIFNEPPPFEERRIRESFELVRKTDDEIVLSRVRVGQEVRLERSDGSLRLERED